MPPLCPPELIAQAERIRLFLDYDGTLADFAPTPEHVFPDAQVVDLVGRLAAHPRVRVAIISGRRLAHVQRLVPVPGVLLAGTYGVELQLADGRRVDRLPFDHVRPILEAVKPTWASLIEGQEGYFLEDKAWALALHARFADDTEANTVLAQGREIAQEAMEQSEPGLFRILGGHKFLEIGPALADKGRTVQYLLDTYPWPGSLPVYLGDDDKDEEAFHVIQAHQGLALVVAAHPRPTAADCRLESPETTRRWLAQLLNRLAEAAS